MRAFMLSLVLICAPALTLADPAPKVKVGPGKTLINIKAPAKAPAKALAKAAPAAPKAAPAAPKAAPAAPKVAAATPASQPTTAPSVVPASTTDADAVTTAQSLWQALHARRWWFAAALGIYLLLFALGRFGVFTKVGTFWAWMLVAVLSVAAGIFAAFDKTGFNWTTFFKYVTAGPTIAYLRDFGKDVLLVKLREWKTKAPPAGPAGPAAAGPLAVLLICVGLGLSSCATWQQNTASACDAAGALAVSASTVGAQQWATACETAARTCKANNDQICQALVKCQSDRHVFDQVIIGVHTARVGGYAAIIAADKIKAKSYVDALATAVKTITDTLAALGVHL